MLKTLDILIGFTLVMLIMSAAVTMLTQLFGSWLMNLKGYALREVIARLLTTLDHGLCAKDAKDIADYILRDPLIAQPNLLSKKQSLAVVVHREELIRLLFGFASGGVPATGAVKESPEPAELTRLRKVLRESLERNGINDPEQILAAIRMATLTLEKISPELSNSARANVAMLANATSDFLAKINTWFDQTIDRASDIFTVRIRMVTVGVSLALVFCVQLNSFELVNRLSVDTELRNSLVNAAIDRAKKAEPAPAPGTQQSSVKDIIHDSGADQLEDFGLIAFPSSIKQWEDGWTKGWVLQLLGIILSAALLSLGAPFWYSLLANLVQLRSVVANRDDKERADRQTIKEGSSPYESLTAFYASDEARGLVKGNTNPGG